MNRRYFLSILGLSTAAITRAAYAHAFPPFDPSPTDDDTTDQDTTEVEPTETITPPHTGPHNHTSNTPTPTVKAEHYLWFDDFNGPAGSAPDRSKWVISNHRTPIKNPVGWDRPPYFYQYRDSRANVFLDGHSNLVLRGTHDGNTFHGGLVSGKWRGAIGTTWEARIKLDCQTSGAWPAWWLSNDSPDQGGEIDIMEWYGNNDWPSGTTVHANPFGTAAETCPIEVDNNWHTWRVSWDEDGMSFWKDYQNGDEPYFQVSSTGIENVEDGNIEWVFNDPGYTVFPILNLAIGGSGGGDARIGSYPADMLIDWVRVF